MGCLLLIRGDASNNGDGDSTVVIIISGNSIDIVPTAVPLHSPREEAITLVWHHQRISLEAFPILSAHHNNMAVLVIAVVVGVVVRRGR